MMPVYNEWTRGTFEVRVVDGEYLANEYDCTLCKAAGIKHEVLDVPHGTTGNDSQWGAGISTTRRECSVCHRWDGPWVAASIVGGGW